MIDYIKIYLPKPLPNGKVKIIFLQMKETENIFILKWTRYGMSLAFNPTKIFNEEGLKGTRIRVNRITGIGVRENNVRGNFHPSDFPGFISAISFVMEKLREKLLIIYSEEGKDFVDACCINPILHESYITEMDVFENIPCKYEAKKYVHDLFANLRIKRHKSQYKAENNTVVYANKQSRQISIYDKTQQMFDKYKVLPERLGNNLRIEIRSRKGSVNVEKDWEVKWFRDLLNGSNYNRLRVKLIEHVQQKILCGTLKNKKIIVDDPDIKKILKRYPYLKDANFCGFFRKYPDVTSYQKAIVNEFGVPKNNSSDKAKREYENIEKIHKPRNKNKILMKELKKYFKNIPKRPYI